MRLQPAHVAVTVDTPDSPAWKIVDSIRSGGFSGRLSLVGDHPGATRSVDSLSPAPDILVLSGREPEIRRQLTSAVKRGVPRAIILSPLDPEARERLAPFASQIHLVGPASEGAAESRALLNITSHEPIEGPGSVGVVTLGSGWFSHISDGPAKPHFSRIVSLGEDWFDGLPGLLHDWRSDASLRVVGIVLDPNRPLTDVLPLLRQTAREKPTVVLWTAEGAQAIARHTGAAVATGPTDFHQLLRALHLWGVWEGDSLALVGKERTSVELARRLLEAEGVRLGPISPETVGLLYRLGALERINPVLLPPAASSEDLARVCEVLARDDLVGAVLVAGGAGEAGERAELASLLARVGRGSTRPVGLLIPGEGPHDPDLWTLSDPAQASRLVKELLHHGKRRFRPAPARHVSPVTPVDFRVEQYGIHPERRYHPTGPRIATWRDPQWGPLVRLETRDATAILPVTYAEAEEWLQELGLEVVAPIAELLGSLRACYDACPELSRVELEATAESGVVNDRGLLVEFS